MNAVFDKVTPPVSGILRLKTVKEYVSVRNGLSELSGLVKIKALKKARELLNLLGYAPNTQTPNSGSLKADDLYAFDENKSKTQRQHDNNAVFDLLNKVERGELQPENLTAADKMTLAKYSGSGGGLKARDGKTGSPHEYYTPAPVAKAMWQAISEMGFSGGKVLDPCGGSGIFGAFAPENSIVQAVEMDETSATVNKLVNGSDRYHVDIASFEERANDIPDNSVDAIVTNVPFGDVSLRKHRNKDSKFQKENLQTYFVLRSLDKLKHGGLAAFIVPSSFLNDKGAKAVNARVLTSQIAEFIGAYRLPNSVFGTAAADVATDVIFYRKYSADVIDKIAELQAQNPEILTQSNVMWDVYTGGQYFRQPENKKFIFGEESQIETWRTDKDGNKKKVYAVINNDSVANIAAAIKKFSGSRIDWALLESTETEPITYAQGDTVFQNGQAYVFDGVKFEAVAASENEAESLANDILSKIQNPLMAFENKITAQQATQTLEHLRRTSQHGAIPNWIKGLMQDLIKVAEAKREQQFKRVIVGLAVQYVMDNFAGNDQTENHADLSEAMKARVPLDKALSRHKKAIEAIKLHYSKTGFSAAWKGESATIEQELTVAKKVEQIQYLDGTLALPVEKVRELGIDPISDNDWCVNADGSEVMKADDYFVGSLKDVLDKIDTDIQAASDDVVREKLLRMKAAARERITPVNVDNMRFGLRSPFVDNQILMRFIEQKLRRENSSMKAVLTQRENGSFFVDIAGTAKTDNDKILARIGDYLNKGNITAGSLKMDVPRDGGGYREASKSEILAQIRETVTAWNAELDTWLKADKAFMAEIAAKANAPENLRFAQVDDESEVQINGASGTFTLHGYQNAFVRKTAREFAPINSFGVGLGKTATSMAAAQYALETGTKRKVCFIVPNAVLSNWNRESSRYFTESERANCLFIGADTDKNGDFVVSSKNYARDLNVVLENRHNKIFMTQQAFEKIRLREETAQKYVDYMGVVDKSFSSSLNAAKDEKAQAKAENLIADIAGKGKLENAPFFEDLGIDALVIDEAHHFKNAKTALENKGTKGLPVSSQSNRAIDMGVKTWFVRGGNPRNDGVMLLTATPVTNSPIEIYAMMSLAVGEERVNQAFLGSVKGADDFINAICEIQTREEQNLTGEIVSTASLVGIKNLDLVQNLIQQNADVKEAADVGMSFKQVESEEVSDGVILDSATKRALDKYKNGYRIARKKMKGNGGEFDNEPQQAIDDYHDCLKELNGNNDLLAHPLSTVNRMSKALLDLDLTLPETRYTVDNETTARKAVDTFNTKSKTTFKTKDKPSDTSLITKQRNTINQDTGETEIEYTVKAVASLENGVVILNCQDFNAQLRLEKLLDDENVGVSVNISPKIAAMLENVKKEQAHIRYTTPSGVKPKFAKQIIFVESLAMHTKIKRLLTQKAGIPSSRITFISGQFNSDPDEIIEVQEKFNGDEEDGYSIVIANKKAEVGINLQKGCQAIHHLELNWTPDSITQRNGRGVRQGNTAEKVSVYFYEADGTFDSYRRNSIDRKSNWIESVMRKDSVNGYAEVGQEPTEKDYDEMINFDGSAAGFAAMQQRQADRKQAEIDRAAIQAQDVNIGIIQAANRWLAENETAFKAVLREAKQAGKDNDELTKANHVLRNSIEKGVKESTIKKNQERRAIAFERMQYWFKRFNGMVFQNDDEYLPIVKIVSDEEKKSPYYGENSDFVVRHYFYDEDQIKIDENHIIIQEWQREREKQIALRESAYKNALNGSNVNGAMPDFALEMVLNHESPIKIKDEFVRKNSIVLGTNGYLYAFHVANVYSFETTGYSRYVNQRGKGGYESHTKLWQPNDPDYTDGVKRLAEWQTKFMRGAFDIKFNGSKVVLPSYHIPDVLDYLPDDLKAQAQQE